MKTMPADSRKFLLPWLNARLSRCITDELENCQKLSVNPNNNISTTSAAVMASVQLPRLMITHCMHVPGNHLRALASPMSFVNGTVGALAVIAEKDGHITTYIEYLFFSCDGIFIMSTLKPKWPFAGYNKWDLASTTFGFISTFQ